MISQQRAEELANRILQNTISSEEEQEWQEWYQSNLEEPIEVPETFAPSKAVHAARMMSVINGAISVKRPVRLWPRIAVAAAAVATIVFGVWFFNSQTGALKQVQGDVAFKNDIAPGKNTATLTLPNGKTIELSDAKTGVMIDASKITYNDNTVISTERSEERSLNNASGKDLSLRFEMTSVSTPRGGTYQVTLPDGTRVWLNADSKLEFPSRFVNNKTRFVRLSGEAYFEVEKQSRSSLRGRMTKQSFIVESEGQQVEVLGTHFNINSYSDEGRTSTTLLEGSVKINLMGQGKISNGVLLKPNEQSVLSNGKISVKQVETSYAVAWKEGYFMFNSERLDIAMNKIARWYNLTIQYEDPTLKEETIFGTISKYENVSKVLTMLEKTGVLVFDIEGKTLKVKRNQTKN